ncbi:DNA phosphorothioation-associated putative methyltransferase [Desulfonatronum thioautotrophicum]|uniref:DNA phosphorothioation-associated putative methyltransferase n=1 Tax=Desulfonatronum thioautotrophicum TaxID=617001 RepID=UPI00069B860A|nr:DNA phosphorothioation-associated putative methyltransferase [Desulfonatronum thioautotrophicum]
MNPPVQRHRTAINRSGLSRPFQYLARHGFLDGERRVFDYGCGRGGDLELLRGSGIQAEGWDPHYAPDQPLAPADVVNLGFVINVVEDPQERSEALSRAFDLAGNVLAVSAMLGRDSFFDAGRSFEDGIITSRDTFQKYYTQTELKDYIESVLQTEAIAVGPGVFFVFKDKGAEQRFLLRRQERVWPDSSVAHLLTCRRETVPRTGRTERILPDELIEALGARASSLGREPRTDDLPEELLQDVVRETRTLGRAMRQVWERFDPVLLEQAAKSRSDGLLVYLALNIFNKRQDQKAMPEQTRRDIRYFFRTIKAAQEAALALLFSAGRPETILDACRQAASDGLGWMDGEHSLTIHSSLLDRLPAVLRVYAGCASRLFGDVTIADLLKFHIHSGKFTLLLVDDFFGRPVPELKCRVKIKLRSQDIDIFEHTEEQYRSLVYLKSRFMHPDMDGYGEQKAFDDRLRAIPELDLSGYGPKPDEFWRVVNVRP